jgi:hypothetical protein
MPGSGRWARFALPLLGATVLLLVVAPSAQATFHLMKVREVYPAGDASYVELQMTAAGEYLVSTHHLVVYNSNGSVANDFPLPSNVSISSPNNATILIADSGYAAAFPSGPSPDELDTNLNLSAAGGAVCWKDGLPPDCVAWGNFIGPLPSTPVGLVVGNPASPGGVSANKALRRSIASGCATFLEQLGDSDDSDDSATDFSEQTPNPRDNASPVTEMTCVGPTPPNTIIGEPKPAIHTSSTGATFNFTASPAAEATFECKLDSEAFAPCTTPKEYTGLSSSGETGTTHTFEVRAVHPTNGTDPTPASYSWTVDTVAPIVTIDTHPADPSPGASAPFTFHAGESSTFQCSLEGPKTEGFAACSSGKTYKSLANGSYTFEVRATDLAMNLGAPQSFTWTVDNSLLDTEPPQTTITSHPPDPSESPNASFTYESNEPGSTFECALDGGAFVSCPGSGISYSGLADGTHSFQVRAIDPSNNVDPTPAGYTFDVVLTGPPPVPPALPPPPPAVSPDTKIGKKPPAKTPDRTPTFKFTSSQPGSGFQCSVDGKAYKPCRSPFTTKSLSFGRHTVKIRAIAGGLTDPSPAAFSFKVMRR